MRLLTSTIYRAFPELDRYDVPQCERFMARARGGAGANAGRVVAVFFAGFATFFCALLGLGTLSRWLWPHSSTGGASDFAMTVTVVVAAISGPMMALFVRDRILHSRIRYILRIRGVCGGCGYSLIGLSLDLQNNVRCPECEHSTTVDPAMAELVVKGEVRTIAAVQGDLAANPSRIDPELVRKSLRWAALGLITLVVAVLIGVGINEVRVRWTVAQARALVSAVPAQNAYFVDRSVRPGIKNVTPAKGLFWQELEALESHFATSAMEVKAAEPYGLREMLNDGMETALPAGDTSPDGTGSIIEFRILPQDVAKVNRLTESGHYQKLLEVLAMEQKARVKENGYREDFGMQMFGFAGAEHVGLAVIERARVAVVDQDPRAFLDSVLSGFRLAHLYQSFPDVMSHWAGMQYEQWVHELIAAGLSSPMRARIVDELEVIYSEEVPNFPASHPWKGFALGAEQAVGPYFQEADQIRFGYLSAQGGIRFVTQHGLGKAWRMYNQSTERLGSLRENIDAYTSGLKEYEAVAALPVRNRIVPAGLEMRDLISLRHSVTMLDYTLVQLDGLREQRNDIKVWIAIEQYRNRTGKLPDSLNALAGAELPLLPRDVSNGKPLGYKRTALGGFLLYGLGADEVDDGGMCEAGGKGPQLIERWHSRRAFTFATGAAPDRAINITTRVKISTPPMQAPGANTPDVGNVPLE